MKCVLIAFSFCCVFAISSADPSLDGWGSSAELGQDLTGSGGRTSLQGVGSWDGSHHGWSGLSDGWGNRGLGHTGWGHSGWHNGGLGHRGWGHHGLGHHGWGNHGWGHGGRGHGGRGHGGRGHGRWGHGRHGHGRWGHGGSRIHHRRPQHHKQHLTISPHYSENIILAPRRTRHVRVPVRVPVQVPVRVPVEVPVRVPVRVPVAVPVHHRWRPHSSCGCHSGSRRW